MKKEESLWVIGHRITPHTISGDFDMVTGETPAGVPGPPPHLHKERDEVFIVLEGEMKFDVDGLTYHLKPGDSIDLPKNSMHTFSNAGNSTCKWLNIHSPQGFWGFFETFGVDSAEQGAQQRSVDPAVIKSVIEGCAEFDMHLAPMPAKA